MLSLLKIFCERSVGRSLRGSFDVLHGPPRCSGPGTERPAAFGVGDWGREGGNECVGVPGVDTYVKDLVRFEDSSGIDIRH